MDLNTDTKRPRCGWECPNSHVRCERWGENRSCSQAGRPMHGEQPAQGNQWSQPMPSAPMSQWSQPMPSAPMSQWSQPIPSAPMSQWNQPMPAGQMPQGNQPSNGMGNMSEVWWGTEKPWSPVMGGNAAHQRPNRACPQTAASHLEQNYPLAMAYVPWQQWQQTYAPERGLAQGTIFPALDLQFDYGRCTR